jgi:outer membrane protein OmpA-like peptidoglycan-associated protein
MTGTKRTLLGGVAVSLALVTMAASVLPARAQDAAEASDCVGLEGAGLEACLAAEGAAERAPDEPDQPEATDIETADPQVQAAEDDTPELLQETEAEAVEDATVDPPAANGPIEPEVTGDAADLPLENDENDGAAAELQSEADRERQPELQQQTEEEAVEEAPVELPEAAEATEGEAETEIETDIQAETDVTDPIEAAESIAAPEAVADDGPADGGAVEASEAEAVEPEPVEAPEAVADDAAVDSVAVDVTEADSGGSEEVLSEEELETAQRASIEEAVQAALAEERQKSQAQQESERDDRMRILGAAAAGLAAGAILPEIGAMLVGQQGDRVILQEDDRLTVRRDETARFLQEGSDSTVDYFADGLSLVTVTRADGSRVLSWRDASGQVVRRAVVLPDGREITLFDGPAVAEPEIRVAELPPIRRQDQRRAFLRGASSEELLRVLSAQPVAAVEDRFTLRQILANDRIRWLMPSLALDAVTFDTGSASLGAEAVEALDTMGRTLSAMVEDDPREVFLVEGHTDAVGSDISNLALSDRRAETVAMLLTSYYGVPPENLLVQGFGEQDLRVPTLGASRENRRVEVRRITPLIR